VGEDYSILGIIAAISHPFPAGSVEPNEVSTYAFRYAIRAVAGLYYWFAREANMIPMRTIAIKNDFDGGTLYIDDAQQFNVPLAGIQREWGHNSVHSLLAVDDQNPGDFRRFFRDWTKGGETFATTLSTSTGQITAAATFEARFWKEFRVGFVNSFSGIGNTGTMEINGQSVTLPAVEFLVRQPNTISATAQGQTINGIGYTFTHWSDGGTSSARTFTPSSHATYTAIFGPGVPRSMKNYGLAVNTSQVGHPVTLTWTDHEDQNVTQYQIWRRIKVNGIMSPPSLRGTVNRGTTSWQDPEYVITNGYTSLLLEYDVRAYYATDQTYAGPDYLTVFGDGQISMEKPAVRLPTAFAVDNHPNPFNPATTVGFALPADAAVDLAVYDILGRTVATLASGPHTAGYHTARWESAGAPGGVYFARFTATAGGRTIHSAVLKLLLVK
jgi:hypothetical protein